MRFLYSFFFVFGIVLQLGAQPQNSNWYFGYNAGVHFDAVGNPTPLNDGILTSRGNATSISDASGNLLLYSDGHRVYNKFHQQILHGDSLYTSRVINASGYHGSKSGNGSILLPSLEDTSVYLLFSCNVLSTVSSGFQPGFLYNKISLTGDSLVLPKNNMLYTAPNSDEFVSERVLAIKHANGRDWWLITHRLNSDVYWVWLYDTYGVHGAYSQQIGQYLSLAGFGGQLTSDKEGNKIISIAGGGYAEVLDFDRCTGQLSNWVDLGFPPYPNINAHIYVGGLPSNGLVAYVGGEGTIYQYDLTASVPKATEFVVYTNPFYNFSLPADSQLQMGWMQLGLDDKLYVALSPAGNVDNQDPATYQFNPRSRYLAVISNPDVVGSGCDFQLDGFYLGGKYSTYSMPNIAYHLKVLIGSDCDTLTAITDFHQPVPGFDFALHPNPGSDQFTCTYNPLSHQGDIEIFDAVGGSRLSVPAQTNSTVVSTKALPAGFYTVKLVENGKPLFVRSWVKT